MPTAFRQLLGLLLGLLARLWLSTLRVRIVVHPDLVKVREQPWVLAFFHGTQWPLLAWRGRRRTVVMVSWSSDGALQARALAALGLAVVRGSSSRGGAAGLMMLARQLRKGGYDAAFAVDGPRGPYGVAKGGAALAARLSRGVIVPVGSAFAHGIVLDRAWDRFGIAWPWSRAVVYLGRALDADNVVDDDVGTAIERANMEANSALARGETWDGSAVSGGVPHATK